LGKIIREIEKEVKPMASILAKEKAAQAWCQPSTQHLEMIPELAEVFAEVLDEVWSKPWLKNATTRELLDELEARIKLDDNLENKNTWSEI